MKKLLLPFASIGLISNLAASIVACEPTAESENTADGMNDISEALRSKTIIVYFSWSNNTKASADYIAKTLDLLTFRLKRKIPYSDNYSELSEDAKNEADNNLRPELKEIPDYINDYDHILLGFPVWWHTAPMIIGSFLQSYDLSGKHIYPFIQSSGYLVEHLQSCLEFLNENSTRGTIIEKEVFSRDEKVINAWINETFAKEN